MITDSTPAIEINNVAFAYDTTPILENVTVTIPQRDFVSIIGPNGGGKTTLLKLALGLLRPDHGEVRVFGEAPERARRQIGYVPQHFQFDKLFPVSALDVTLMGRLGRFAGGHTRADRAAAARALEEVDLGVKASQSFASLSGGQRQRVLIARALASEPRMLLLDEPTANIDITSEDDLYSLLTHLNERMTVVMVSHDVGVVASLVNTVVCVNRTATTHPTTSLTGDTLAALYGEEARSIIRHDHGHADGHGVGGHGLHGHDGRHGHG